MDAWSLKGELILNCNCTVFCPCVISLGKHLPTEGHCQAWAGIRIDKGKHGKTNLGGLNVALLLEIPERMARGNWTAAAWIDERANDAQFDALVQILSGKAKGSTGIFSIVVGSFLGAERAPVTYENDGVKRRLTVPKKIMGEVQPIPGGKPGEAVVVKNSQYWIAPDIVVAEATQSRVRAFGRVWDFAGRSAEICQIDWKGP
ncbi:MAG: DUF1326 domain-containing protein [Hyphomicrobiaceae bacterium]|jgi:hypothetical protein